MLNIDKIKKDFSYIKAMTGNTEVYNDTLVFEGYDDSCDLYFKSLHKQIKQEQVEKYNEFKENYENYLPEIETYILSSLKNSEINFKEVIKKTDLKLDIIEIPYDDFKYDLVLICSKTYKKFIFLTQNIDIRVEFKSGRIKTIQRKKDTTEENE